jgi:hypothetical protein
MIRHGTSDLPEEFYEIARDIADDVIPYFRGEIADLADEYDATTAMGIGAAAMVFLIVGLGETYDDQMNQPADTAASRDLAGAVTEALNKRLQKSVARANGDLN